MPRGSTVYLELFLRPLGEDGAELLLSAAEITKAMKHPRIVSFHGLLRGPNSNLLAYEFMEFGRLDHFLLAVSRIHSIAAPDREHKCTRVWESNFRGVAVTES